MPDLNFSAWHRAQARQARVKRFSAWRERVVDGLIPWLAELVLLYFLGHLLVMQAREGWL